MGQSSSQRSSNRNYNPTDKPEFEARHMDYRQPFNLNVSLRSKAKSDIDPKRMPWLNEEAHDVPRTPVSAPKARKPSDRKRIILFSFFFITMLVGLASAFLLSGKGEFDQEKQKQTQSDYANYLVKEKTGGKKDEKPKTGSKNDGTPKKTVTSPPLRSKHTKGKGDKSTKRPRNSKTPYSKKGKQHSMNKGSMIRTTTTTTFAPTQLFLIEMCSDTVFDPKVSLEQLAANLEEELVTLYDLTPQEVQVNAYAIAVENCLASLGDAPSAPLAPTRRLMLSSPDLPPEGEVSLPATGSRAAALAPLQETRARRGLTQSQDIPCTTSPEEVNQTFPLCCNSTDSNTQARNCTYIVKYEVILAGTETEASNIAAAGEDGSLGFNATTAVTPIGVTVSSTPSPVSATASRSLTSSMSVTASPSFTSSVSVTASPSLTSSVSVTASPSLTSSVSVTASPSLTSSVSVTASPSLTSSVSVTASPSLTSSVSVTASPSFTRSVSVTASPSLTSSVSVTASPSLTSSVSVTASPSLTSSVSVTASPSLTSSVSATASPSLTSSVSVTVSPSLTSSVSVTASPSLTSSVSVTASPSLTSSVSVTASPSLTSSVSLSATSSVSVSPSQSVSRSVGASDSATSSVSVSASPSLTSSLSVTASPSLTSSVSVTASPSLTSSVSVTASPSLTSSVSVTASPSLTSSVSVTASPSLTSSVSVTASPSLTSSVSVTASPSLTSSVSLSATSSVSVSPSQSVSRSVGASDPATSSVSVSASPSLTSSLSVTASPSLTSSASVTASPSLTSSVSVTASPSLTSSASLSTTSSVSVSPSQSVSRSVGASDSTTSSVSVSASPSLTSSVSVTASPSLTSSVSATASPSLTSSVSVTVSPSLTSSVSVTASPSLTSSVSVTASPSLTSSVSVTASPSLTSSVSVTASPSLTSSVSVTASPSLTSSVSVTASPSFTSSVSVSASQSATSSVSVTASQSSSPVCGELTQPCCPIFDSCNADDAVCVSGTCEACGGLDQPCCAFGCNEGECSLETERCVCGELTQRCCPDDSCNAEDAVCVSGTCEACGGRYQRCCPPFNSCTTNDTVCVLDECIECGGLYEPCCSFEPGTGCNEGECRIENGTCACTTNDHCPAGLNCTQSGHCACENGCAIPIYYVNDEYCDCTQCEDEDNWDCNTCGEGCPTQCDNYTKCNGCGGLNQPCCSTTSGTGCNQGAECRNGTCGCTTNDHCPAGLFCTQGRCACENGCDIPIDYVNDGDYCDCTKCEDEDNWNCSTCEKGCPTQCDDFTKCNGTGIEGGKISVWVMPHRKGYGPYPQKIGGMNSMNHIGIEDVILYEGLHAQYQMYLAVDKYVPYEYQSKLHPITGVRSELNTIMVFSSGAKNGKISGQDNACARRVDCISVLLIHLHRYIVMCVEMLFFDDVPCFRLTNTAYSVHLVTLEVMNLPFFLRSDPRFQMFTYIIPVPSKPKVSLLEDLQGGAYNLLFTASYCIAQVQLLCHKQLGYHCCCKCEMTAMKVEDFYDWRLLPNADPAPLKD
eukprot:g6558.t1